MLKDSKVGKGHTDLSHITAQTHIHTLLPSGSQVRTGLALATNLYPVSLAAHPMPRPYPSSTSPSPPARTVHTASPSPQACASQLPRFPNCFITAQETPPAQRARTQACHRGISVLTGVGLGSFASQSPVMDIGVMTSATCERPRRALHGRSKGHGFKLQTMSEAGVGRCSCSTTAKRNSSSPVGGDGEGGRSVSVWEATSEI